jgi:dCTP deaminase
VVDPGFQGYLTLEMRNQGGDSLVIEEGMPICKIVFRWLDEPTEQPHRNGGAVPETQRTGVAS